MDGSGAGVAAARGAAGKEGRERQLLSLPSWMRGRGEGASALLFLQLADGIYSNYYSRNADVMCNSVKLCFSTLLPASVNAFTCLGQYLGSRALLHSFYDLHNELFHLLLALISFIFFTFCIECIS